MRLNKIVNKGNFVALCFVSLFLSLAIYGFATGEVFGFGGRNTGQGAMVSRIDYPIVFWVYVVIYIGLALFTIFARERKNRKALEDD